MGWTCVRCAFNGELWFPAKTFTGDLVLANRVLTVQGNALYLKTSNMKPSTGASLIVRGYHLS